jgi:hypothetical protein
MPNEAKNGLVTQRNLNTWNVKMVLINNFPFLPTEASWHAIEKNRSAASEQVWIIIREYRLHQYHGQL